MNTHTEAFETELAALIERHSKLTSDQVITVLERALDEALAIAGETEASTVRHDLLDVARTFLDYATDMRDGHLVSVAGSDLRPLGSEDVERIRAAIAKAGPR